MKPHWFGISVITLCRLGKGIKKYIKNDMLKLNVFQKIVLKINVIIKVEKYKWYNYSGKIAFITIIIFKNKT